MLPHAPFSFTFLFIFTFSFAATLPNLANAQYERRTFETCDIKTKCGSPLYCANTAKLPYKACSAFAETCQCIPVHTVGFRTCTLPENCPVGEDCAVSATSGRLICMGCQFLATRPEIALVTRNSRKCRIDASPSPTPAPVGALGRTFDFCSLGSPCAPRYACTAFGVGRPCGPQDTLCQCFTQNGAVDCTTEDECPVGESCALNLPTGERKCTSCVYAKLNLNIKRSPNSTQCVNVGTAHIPSYPAGSNGFAFDACQSDFDCVTPRRCRINTRGRPLCTDEEAGTGNCKCFEKEYTKSSCISSTDCDRGELCAFLFSEPFRACVSERHVNALNKDERTIYGQHPLATPLPDGSGISRESCNFDWECRPPRRCTHFLGRYGGCIGRRGCTCKAVLDTECENDDVCAIGERCANYRGARTAAFCVSRAVMARDLDLVPITEAEKPAPKFAYSPKGLTGDRCREDSDCSSTEWSRICRHITETNGACEGRDGCFCVLENEEEDGTCETTLDCPQNEVCVTVFGAPADYVPKCRSEAATEEDKRGLFDVIAAPSPSPKPVATGPRPPPPPPTATPEPEPTPTPIVAEPVETEEPVPSPSEEEQESAEPICFDAVALEHLPANKLVFPRARRAAVMCDPHGNCATAGHIVVWRGTAMMMRSYCDTVVGEGGCVRRTMLVNSPKITGRGLRVASRFNKDNGFEFTAFAARFESVVEEAVLTRLVHMGL